MPVQPSAPSKCRAHALHVWFKLSAVFCTVLSANALVSHFVRVHGGGAMITNLRNKHGTECLGSAFYSADMKS